MNVRYFLFLLIGYVLSCTLVYADCQAPQFTYTNTITHQSASVSWSYYGSNSPTFQLQWRALGSATWTTTPAQTATNTSLTGLINNTTYEWHVRTICAVGDTSVYTTSSTFQTKCDLPYYLGVDNVTHQSARLSWSASTSGATYEVQWRPAGATTWTIVNGLIANTLNLTGLSDETSYEWKIRTVCAPSISSDFISGPVFQTRCLPPTNAHLTQSNPNAVELKWDSPVINGLFDLQWRLAGTSDWVLIEGISASEYILTGLTNETTYEWQVRTACSATSKSTFSTIQPFRTGCPSPTNLATTSITYNSAVLQWTSPASELQWRVSGATDWITVPLARSPYSLTGLITDTAYEWRVRTICSASAVSGYTSSQLFIPRCLAPTGASGYANGGGLELYWAASDSGPFEVQWRLAGTSSWTSVQGITNTSYRLMGLAPASIYEWRVRKMCSNTDYSAFFTAQPIQTTCSTPGSLQSGNPTNTTIDLLWSSEEASARYELQWRVVNAANWITVAGIASASYTLTGIQPGISYEWRVRKVCSDQVVSAFTTSQTFTLTCSQPSYFYVYTISPSSATASWYGSSVYPPYELQYRLAGATGWTSVSGLTNSVYSFSGLTNNTTYEWRVKSACSAVGATDFSAINTFQTQCGPPLSNLAIEIIDVNSARLTWQNTTNAGLYEIQYRDVTSNSWVIVRPEGSETDYSFNGPVYTDKHYTLYGLTPGKTYDWRIRILCTPAIYSDFSYGPTFTAACSTPQGLNSYQQTNTSVSIYWNATTSAISYDLQWRALNTSSWSTVSGLTNSQYVLTDLTPGVTYEYRVRQLCSLGLVSDYSGASATLVKCLVPYTSTTEALSSTSVRLTWMYYNTNNNDAAMTAHDLQYRLSGTSSWTLISGITGTTYSLTGLTTGASYEWRISAACTQSVMSDFSSISTFGLTCPTPFSYGYTTQTSATTARLSWINSYYSTLTNQSFLLRWRVLGTTVWSTQSVSTGTYSLTGLTNNTTYEWQVATDCVGFLSDFSTIQTFQTSCPSVQYLSLTSVGATNAQLSWGGSNLPPGLAYTLQYRIGGTVVWSEINALMGTTTSLTGLASKTTYEWRVRTNCESGVVAAFSPSSTFSTQCPTLMAVYNYTVTAQSALISWAASADHVFVNLQWRPINSSALWNRVDGLTSSGYSLTGLTPNTYYEYQLQGVCSANDLNQPVANTFMTTATTTTFYVFTDSTSFQAARLNWTGAPDRTNYVFQWRINGGNWNTTGPLSAKKYLLTNLSPNTVYDVRVSYVGDNAVTYEATTSFLTSCPRISNTIATAITPTTAKLTWTSISAPVLVQWRIAGTTSWNSVTGVMGGTYSLTGLSTATLYEWRLQAVCSSVSNVTYPITFRTGCLMPNSTATLDVSTQTAQLSWSGTAASYSMRYRIVGATTWTTITGLTSTTYALTGLTTNAVYEWAVAAVCDPNTGTPYTSSIRFTTQCVLPPYVSVNAAAPDRVQVSWSGAEPSYQLQWRMLGTSTWNNIPAATSPYTLTGLVTGAAYEGRLRGTCAVAGNGPFIIYSFSPQCSAYYYSDNRTTINIKSTTAQLIWTANPLLTYGLRWRVIGSTTWTTAPGNVTSPYTLTGLVNNTSYEWQLRTECQPTYTTSLVFQTACTIPSGLWVEPLTATSVNLHWVSSGEGVSYELQWRAVGTAVWTTISNRTSTSYVLTGLTNYANYEWQVRSQCVGNSPFQLTAFFKLADECSFSIYTVRAGSWDDPTVWSCTRVPTLNDQVKLNHALAIPNAYVAKALTIRYETGAKLTFGIGASIKMGN